MSVYVMLYIDLQSTFYNKSVRLYNYPSSPPANKDGTEKIVPVTTIEFREDTGNYTEATYKNKRRQNTQTEPSLVF